MKIEQNKRRLRDLSAELCENVLEYANVRINLDKEDPGVRSNASARILFSLYDFVDCRTRELDNNLNTTPDQIALCENTLTSVNRHLNPKEKESRRQGGRIPFHALEASIIAYRMVSPAWSRNPFSTSQNNVYNQARKAVLSSGCLEISKNEIGIHTVCNMAEKAKDCFKDSEKYIFKKKYLGDFDDTVSVRMDNEFRGQMTAMEEVLSSLANDGDKHDNTISHKLKQTYLLGTAIRAMTYFHADAKTVTADKRMFPLVQVSQALQMFVPDP